MKYSQLSPEQKKQLQQRLAASPNVATTLHILNKEFDLDNCKPGTIVRGELARQLVQKVLPYLNPDTR